MATRYCTKEARHRLGLAAIIAIFPINAIAQDTGNVVRWQKDGLRLEIAALGQDQIAAFFIGRGFDPAASTTISAEGCVFRSNIGHMSDKSAALPVAVDLTAWRIIIDGGEYRPRTREDWAPIWKEKKIGSGPRTAFKWALFPTEQTFGPTDYNWGMLTFGQPPGTRFDLKIVWRYGLVTHETRLTGLECSK